MHAQLLSFGKLEIDGQVYDYDVTIEAGQVQKRKKKASRAYRDRYGHTPLSAEEPLPLGGDRLIIGTGAYGRLPVMPEVAEAAQSKQVSVVTVPTAEACSMIGRMDDKDVHAILHVTC